MDIVNGGVEKIVASAEVEAMESADLSVLSELEVVEASQLNIGSAFHAFKFSM